MEKRVRSEQPLCDRALKNVNDKKVLACPWSFVYFLCNETSFREITREIFLLSWIKNVRDVVFDKYVCIIWFNLNMRNFLIF